MDAPREPKFFIGQRVLWRGALGRWDEEEVAILEVEPDCDGPIMYRLDNGCGAYEWQLRHKAS